MLYCTPKVRFFLSNFWGVVQDPELRALAKASREKQEAFNQEVDPKKGAAIIKEWFGSTGDNLYLNRQVLVDYGVNIHLGEHFYAN